MTEELSALIASLTCPKCNGTGVLAWRTATQTAGVISTFHNLRSCDVCKGDGLTPNARNPSHA